MRKKSSRCISPATCCISSRLGVIRPDRPMMSAPSTLALREDVLARDHHAHVDDLEVVALEDDGDDVLADVVDVALDGRDDDLALGLRLAAALDEQQLLGLDVGQQVGDGLLHHARRLHHLRQEHLALAEQVADDVHAGHQRAFDDVQRPSALGLDLLPRVLGVLDDELGDAVDERVREPLVDRLRLLGRAAPGQARRVVARHALGALGDLDQALAGGRRRLAGLELRHAVEDDVLDPLAQLRVEVVVDADHAGVDDAHVHPRLDRVIEEHGVDGFPDRVVAAKREAHVGDAARDLGAGQVRLDPARRVDEVDGVVVVLLDAGGDREDVRVEDDVLGRGSRPRRRGSGRRVRRSRSCARSVSAWPFSSNAITTAAAP